LCCLSLSFRPEFQARQMSDLSFIDLCSRLNLDGVDFNLSSLQALEKDHLKKIKKSCLEHGLTIACIGVSNDFGRPPEQQEMVQDQIRQGLDAAQFLGAPVVRLFAGTVRDGDTREAVWKRCVVGLRRAAEYAEKVGVMAALQNHNHKNVTSTGADVVRLLDEVNHAWCSHILDTGQYLGSLGASGAKADDAQRHNVYQSIQQTAARAVLVRAKLYRLRSGKEEWLDYDRIFKILRSVQFNGFVSLVYEGWSDMDAMHAVPAGVKFLRNYLLPHW
ncbi:MAG TPA: sugar phosphate isomerase/epimerase family protein, partial [Gemmataceae bacterium]|nr:sugar phosphate isomerase/epimerase family protein [Gemmataceae bacterium]